MTEPSPAAAESDPFEELNRGYGAGTVRDPYPRFAELRRACPVQPGSPHTMLGLDLAVIAEGAPPIFTVLGHDAVSEVLRDGQRFSSSSYRATMGIVMGHTILEMDEPEHGRYRALLQKGFTRKALLSWERDLIGPVVNQHIDRFAANGRADLVRELTFPFPVTVIAGMLGLPDEDLPQFHRWAIELISIGFDWERGLRASKALHDYLGGVVAERRRDPREDIISVLGQAELEATRLTDDEIIAFLRLLLPAGAETTYRSSSNLLFGLLSHPDQLAAVAADRTLILQAIEEGLRWEPPLTGIIRCATRDTEICGVPIPKGALLSVCVAAANRDETRYPDPDRFDIHRPQRQNMAFGFGAHRCLGMHLARIETQVVLEALLDRCPGLRLDPAAEDVHITGLVFRSPSSLPVLFDVRA
jgi:cytochrome P450